MSARCQTSRAYVAGMSRTRFALAGTALVLVFLLQAVLVVHREAMTNDEGCHTCAGYRYRPCGDFGANPEHPPPANRRHRRAPRFSDTKGQSCLIIHIM